MKPTAPALIQKIGAYARSTADERREPFKVATPYYESVFLLLDAVELATIQVTTPAADWEPHGKGLLFHYAARLASADMRGELWGMSGFAIARLLQLPQKQTWRTPFAGLDTLRQLDADNRTGIVVTLDGAAGVGDDPYSRRIEERLRDRLSDDRAWPYMTRASLDRAMAQWGRA